MQIATHYPPCLAQRYAKEKGIKNLSAILRDENLPLPELLRAGGLVLESGMPNIRDIVTSTVLVEAVDGYRVVFSLAELDPTLTDRVILLADTKDGQPLPSREGPFRIIVPGDKLPARWVRQVKSVTVHRD